VRGGRRSGNPLTVVESGGRGPLEQAELAARIARDIPSGAYVNLGIGKPTKVADYLDPAQHITLHTENGMLGMGRTAQRGEVDADLINAGKIPVTESPGASYFDHAESFAMIRGGHLDICVLGAFQVSFRGDLANWHTDEVGAIPSVGGAMDLAVGAKSVWIMMNLFSPDGSAKLVETCSYPLTAVNCVSRLYTDYAIFAIENGRPMLLETFGISPGDLVQRLALDLADP
jgi:3-oxoadipate CoA-transferase, beta subunit